jgi:hypothetical protein
MLQSILTNRERKQRILLEFVYINIINYMTKTYKEDGCISDTKMRSVTDV